MQIIQSVPWLTFVMSIVPPILVQLLVAYWLSKVSERNKIAVVNEIEELQEGNKQGARRAQGAASRRITDSALFVSNKVFLASSKTGGGY